MVDVVNAYTHGFKYACDIRPSQCREEKFLKLSYMDALTEQLFGAKMIRKNGQYIWIDPQYFFEFFFNSHLRIKKQTQMNIKLTFQQNYHSTTS